MISPMRFVVCNVGRVTYFSFAKYQKEEKREEIHNTEKEGEVKEIREKNLRLQTPENQGIK